MIVGEAVEDKPIFIDELGEVPIPTDAHEN